MYIKGHGFLKGMGMENIIFHVKPKFWNGSEVQKVQEVLTEILKKFKLRF